MKTHGEEHHFTNGNDQFHKNPTTFATSNLSTMSYARKDSQGSLQISAYDMYKLQKSEII
jgi:hypothetical protein